MSYKDEFKQNYTIYENVIIQCNVNAYGNFELPKIKWIKNENETVEAIESFNQTSLVSKLYFNPPTRKDSGNYSCSVINSNLPRLSEVFALIILCNKNIDCHKYFIKTLNIFFK